MKADPTPAGLLYSQYVAQELAGKGQIPAVDLPFVPPLSLAINSAGARPSSIGRH